MQLNVNKKLYYICVTLRENFYSNLKNRLVILLFLIENETFYILIMDEKVLVLSEK